jgi:hypothetical protein
VRLNPLITRKYLARGAGLWIGARLIVSLFSALAGTDPLRFTFAAAMVTVGATVALGVADMYRRHERALLENLTVSRTRFLLFLAVPAILGEIIVSFVATLRG